MKAGTTYFLACYAEVLLFQTCFKPCSKLVSRKSPCFVQNRFKLFPSPPPRPPKEKQAPKPFKTPIRCASGLGVQHQSWFFSGWRFCWGCYLVCEKVHLRPRVVTRPSFGNDRSSCLHIQSCSHCQDLCLDSKQF